MGHTIALAGNPNSGKTTLFNALTGSNQYVGNWPGVTVEKKEGKLTSNGDITLVDLPGIYSLSPYSMEEIVARDFIIKEKPDAIINIIDATNLERNLYLTVQLLELERPIVVALNMMDEVEKRGDIIDTKKLSRLLGAPVVPISARTSGNIDALLAAFISMIMNEQSVIEPDDLYDDFTHMLHHRIDDIIASYAVEAKLPAHWASIKLLEGDKLVESALKLSPLAASEIDKIAKEYEASDEYGDRETLIADSRYKFIERIVAQSVQKIRREDYVTVSERIDRVVTNKWLALPMFLAIMLLIFSVTFGPIGTFLSDGVDHIVNIWFAGLVNAGLEAAGASGWLTSLIVDGIIPGVGGVLTFLPLVALLFFCLSLLEDSGYMARAAFIMDRMLRKIGLSGKAFIPMLMGFGCTVPAIMGARTMENEKDKRMTIMLLPFMSCSARLPVYALFCAAFFGRGQGLVVFGLYVLGMTVAILSGLILKRTMFRGTPAPFVLELPPYRLPVLKNTLRHVWVRIKDFLTRAGTVILIMSVVLWVFTRFDFTLTMVGESSHSMLGMAGNYLAPLFEPLGFGTWQATVSLLTGLIAKEAVVSSLSMFYGFAAGDGAGAMAALSGAFTPLSAFSFLVFVLLYLPCIAAVATMSRELNSRKWMFRAVVWNLGAAYLITLAIYQMGRLLGLS